jgi:prevent-host-death family protein
LKKHSAQPQKKARSKVSERATKAWQLQTAKAHFVEIFRLVRLTGLQRITRQGKESVVVLRAEDFDRLINKSRQPKSLVKFFAESPQVGSGIDLERKLSGGVRRR